jgi:hypothetical protein
LLLTKLALGAPAFAAPGPGQSGLAVGSDAAGGLRAAACAAEPCKVDGGVALAVPSNLKAGVAKARLAVVGIGNGRRAIVVTVPGAGSGQNFEAVVAMPPGARDPRILFQGLTGLVEGSDGVRQGKSVTISEPDEDGARRIIVGDEREDLNLCGRRAVLAPSIVNPADLTRPGDAHRRDARRIRSTAGGGRAARAGRKQRRRHSVVADRRKPRHELGREPRRRRPR